MTRYARNRPTALRFLLPKKNAKLLNVRERDEAGKKLSSRPARVGNKNGRGLATRKVCGKKPKRVDFLRPVGVRR